MSVSDKEDGEVLSDGELEDGELPSSDEEEGTTKNEEPPNDSPKSPTGSQPESQVQEARAALKRSAPEDEAGAAESLKPEAKKSKLDPASPVKDEDAEEGEIFSDDEEAAYFPQLVKSRPSENQVMDEDKERSKEAATSPQRWGRKQRDTSDDKLGENIYVTGRYYSRRERSPSENDDLEDREGSKNSDNDGGGRERERDRKWGDHSRKGHHHDSPSTKSKYGRNQRYFNNRDQDSDRDDDEGSEYSRGQYSYKGRKGYGSRGHFQYRHQRYGGRNTRQWDQSQSRGGYGGYGSYPGPGQMNTGLTAKQFHSLASKVAKRREKGLSLLPNPDTPLCNNLDQFNYPAPPSWYLDAVEMWEKKMKEREEAERQGITVVDATDSTSGAFQQADGTIPNPDNKALPPETDTKKLPSLMQLSLNLPLEQPVLIQQPPVPNATQEPIPQHEEGSVQPEKLPDTEKESCPGDVGDRVSEDMDIEEVTMEEDVSSSLQTSDKCEDDDSAHLLPRKSIDSEQDVDDFDYDTYLDQLVDEEEDDDTGDPAQASSKSLSSRVIPAVNYAKNNADLPTNTTTTPSLKSLFEQDIPLISHSKEEITSTTASDNQFSDQSFLIEGANPLSEDFPLINPSNRGKGEVGMSQKQSGSTNQSLKALVGQEVDLVVVADEGKDFKEDSRRAGSKSSRRKQKDTVWWAKQKEREALASKRAEEMASKFKMPCKYFVGGFCKHGENCQYSHDIPREKKKDICKFYLQDSCNKGDDCLYYHGTFPCKFYHTKTFCKHGDNCRFSHAPLTAETRELLMSVLESPKDFSKLPEFPASSPVMLPVSSPVMLPAVGGSVPNIYTGSLQLYPDPRQHLVTPAIPIAAESQVQRDGVRDGVGVSVAVSAEHEGGATDKGGGFIVSIPKHITDENSLIVSISLSKVRSKFQTSHDSLANPPPPQPPQPPHPPHPPHQFVPNQQQAGGCMYQQAPPVPFPFQQTGMVPQPPLPPQVQPIPLFPPKEAQFGVPNLAPHGNSFIPPPSQRKALLPTPPPHVKLTPEDLKRMENSQPEYWEAPELSQYGQPPGYQEKQFQAHVQENFGPTAPISMPPVPAQYYMPPPAAREDPRHDMRQAADPRQGRTADFRRSELQHYNIAPNPPRPFITPPLPPFSQHGTNSVPSVPGARVGMEHGQHPSMPVLPSVQAMAIPSVQGLPPFGGGEFQHTQAYPYAPPLERTSPVWGSGSATSPEHPSSRREGGISSPADPRRVDPRTKYAHLKIKPKNQSASAAVGHPGSQSILKKGQTKEEKSPEKNSKPFAIPKLLKDPSALERPLDPRELFSGSTEADEEYGEIQAPFGTFGSYFSRTQEVSHSPVSERGQPFGEITLNMDTKCEAEEHPPEKMPDIQVESPTESKGASSPSKPQVPSYFAHLDLGLDSDLQIESAFGSLGEKNKGEDGNSLDGGDSKQKLDTAKKLPSIFGFGL